MKWSTLLIGFLSLNQAANAQTSFTFFEPVQPPRKVQLMVHRGLHMMAPENSLPAVLGCASDYIEWAEVDINLTKDGKHVILHDSTVDRTTDGKGRVTEKTLDELLQLEAGLPFSRKYKGTKLLTFEQLLRETKGKVNLYLDCKRINPELLVKEIQDAGMEKQVIVYDGLPNIAKVKALSANTIPVMTKFRPKQMNFDAFVKDVAPAAVEIDADQVTSDLCKAFHDKGIKVQAKVLGEKWDNPKVWTEVIQAGVDWLQTDDPLGLRFTEVRMRIPQFPVKIAYHRAASRYAPENSLPAIQKAVAAGADYIEIDIRTLKDGKHILLHDSKLDRTTSGTGLVKEQDLESIKAFNAGEWFAKPFYSKAVIPTLDEALGIFGDKSHVYLDAKDIKADALLAAIKKHNLMDRHVVCQSFDYCLRIRELDPGVKTIPGFKKLVDQEKLIAAKPFGVDASWSLLTKETIEKFHENKVQVFSDAMGANENVPQYRKAIQWGLDVIQTDHPLRVLRAIELEAKP